MQQHDFDFLSGRWQVRDRRRRERLAGAGANGETNRTMQLARVPA